MAGNNGVALWGRTEEGFATDPIMVANNLIFVATRIQIQMESYPKWCAIPATPSSLLEGPQSELSNMYIVRPNW